jgi:uncharacterized protein YndB with AHSA1/START domain
MNDTTGGSAVVTLPTDTQIRITRELAAPRHLVYRAYTEPALVRQWWSGDQGEPTLVEYRRSSPPNSSSAPRSSRACRTPRRWTR